MRIELLNERIIKAEETINKKKELIVKRNKSIDKKRKELEALGFDSIITTYDWLLNNRGLNNWDEAYWIACDINHYEESINDANRVISEKEESLIKMRNQLDVEIQKENAIDNLPELFIEFKDSLVKAWDEFDINRRDSLYASYKELGYRDFCKKYGYGAYDKLSETDEHIHQQNVKDSKELILDLLDRVSYKTGKITDFAGLHVSTNNAGYAILNGIVIGEKDTAVVDSILAGGYNIQRLHVRVLVK